MTTDTPPAYTQGNAEAPPPFDAHVTPLPPPPPRPIRSGHAIASPEFIRSAAQNHLRSSFLFPPIADLFIDFKPARDARLVRVDPVAVFAVDAIRATEERRLVTKSEPNKMNRLAMVGHGSLVFVDHGISWLTRAFTISNETVDQLFSVPIKASLIGDSSERLKFKQNALVQHETDYSLISALTHRFQLVLQTLWFQIRHLSLAAVNVLLRDSFLVRNAMLPGKLICKKCDGTVSSSRPKNRRIVINYYYDKENHPRRVRPNPSRNPRNTTTTPTSKTPIKTTTPCPSCKSTGRKLCETCNATGKRICKTCDGTLSTLTYLSLRVSRLLHHTTNYFQKPISPQTSLYQTTGTPTPIPYPHKVPTRVIWESVEIDPTSTASTTTTRTTQLPTA
ncbi:hypothetical protein BCR33DRAFT_498884 [Rhizoclosmatium globosum]|uniref:Uncharacterized protein n=1 Tax=Rhizoclosmatium globosum TaxID=329046 RepID=A0A1Y2CVM5_9FUNG|nr:hypothetical protein BCR33DRAFT_498884 [Rhizoclosmatium globosum]|eukprot:ORY50946.1 hypothetical protein BCR33DRAFT_498884 [Rhizoclosmatium globosum]